MKYIHFPKGTTKKQKAIRLKAERERLNLPPYNADKCKHPQTVIVSGNWGPHRAKQICAKCDKHIRWAKIQHNPYEQRTGSKYQYGSNTGTKGCAVKHNENSRSSVDVGIQHPENR